MKDGTSFCIQRGDRRTHSHRVFSNLKIVQLCNLVWQHVSGWDVQTAEGGAVRSQVKEGMTASDSVFEGVNRLPNKNGRGKDIGRKRIENENERGETGGTEDEPRSS